MALKFQQPDSINIKNIKTIYWKNTNGSIKRIGKVVWKNAQDNVVNVYRLIYPVIGNIEEGNLTVNTLLYYEGAASCSIVPNTGYTYPENVTADYATVTNYDSKTGTFTLDSPIVGTNNVTVTAACVKSIYQINLNITNGTTKGPTTIEYGATVTLNIVPNSKYTYPQSIQVEGDVGFNYDPETGTIELFDALSGITITATCPSGSILAAPTLGICNDLLLITDNDGNAEQFDIYGDEEYETTVDKES